jgi:vacuolar-type H+-ATPase subunit F/Vma7
MGTVAVLGERALAQGYALVGANMLVAETAEDARAQWERLSPDVLVVILTPTAAAALGASRTSLIGPMTVVMPA